MTDSSKPKEDPNVNADTPGNVKRKDSTRMSVRPGQAFAIHDTVSDDNARKQSENESETEKALERATAKRRG